MKYILSVASAIALCSTLVAADIKIVAGAFNDPFGGGTGTNIYVVSAALTPDCNNLGSPRILGEDASSGGAACDGCNIAQPINDWEITRFELFDGSDTPVTKQQYGSLTAYLESDGKYGLNAGSGDEERRIGRCDRVKGADLQCFQGLTTAFPTQIFTCFGETEPVDAAD